MLDARVNRQYQPSLALPCLASLVLSSSGLPLPPPLAVPAVPAAPPLPPTARRPPCPAVPPPHPASPADIIPLPLPSLSPNIPFSDHSSSFLSSPYPPSPSTSSSSKMAPIQVKKICCSEYRLDSPIDLHQRLFRGCALAIKTPSSRGTGNRAPSQSGCDVTRSTIACVMPSRFPLQDQMVQWRGFHFACAQSGWSILDPAKRRLSLSLHTSD